MGHVIEVSFSGDPEAVVAKAKAAAERYGATFSGDHVAGRFSGNGIEGEYRFTETVVVLTIENKPDFVPWVMVETAFRSFFQSATTKEVATTTADEPPRDERANAIIRKHVLFSSGAGLIPIPLADVAAVTAVQVSMLRDLSKLHGVELSQRLLENFVTALTGGMLARLGASAVKALPGIGTLLGGASMSIMSGASTYAVGRVAKRQLESTGSLANADLAKAKREYDSEYESGKDVVAKLNETDDPKPK
jgi:uncharacterized protein (DUF697 family)